MDTFLKPQYLYRIPPDSGRNRWGSVNYREIESFSGKEYISFSLFQMLIKIVSL